MLIVNDSCFLNCANISFGHMIKIESYKEQLLPILNAFKEDIVTKTGLNNGILTVLLSGYGKATLLDINNIIDNIRKQLGEELTFSVEFKDVKEIRDYINITLIRI